MTVGVARAAWRRVLAAACWVAAWAGLVLVACLGIFVVLDLLPGDAASQRLGQDATPEALAVLRHQYGLDRPVLERFGGWLAGVLRGDFGVLLASGQPVGPVLDGPVQRTAVLALFAGVGVTVVGFGGALLAGLRAGGPVDRLLSSAALAALCTPEFVAATVVVLVFSSWLGWLPAVSLPPPEGGVWGRPVILVAPTVTLVAVGSAALLRQVRPIVVRQAAGVHVEAARLAGHEPWRVLGYHLLPGVLAPAAQAGAAIVPYLVGGTIVVERAFAYPGLGSLLVSSVANREPALLMACALIVVAVTALAYRGADLLGSHT